MKMWLCCAVVVLANLGAGAFGQINVPGADGSDGELNITGNTWMHLSDAPPGDWNGPNADPGKGVYDQDKWAVVFRYTSVSINSGKWIQYTNHPSRAPIVWLVSGDVSISGSLYVHGKNQQGSAGFAEPGPGGFRGGRGAVATTPASAGFGPGGGDHLITVPAWSAASHASFGGAYQVAEAPTYGNLFVLPLMGGSGGAAQVSSSRSGGGGGGAILIAATGTITVSGNIYAYGGEGHGSGGCGGSGGAIRLIADAVQGSGFLRAHGGAGWRGGGAGRIFVQANQITLAEAGSPAAVQTNFIDSPYLIWPDSVDPAFPDTPIAPKIWPVKLVVDGMDVDIPEDPRANLDFPLADLSFDTIETVDLHISATNMPTDWVVKARIVAKAGDSLTTEPAQFVSGDFSESEWVITGIDLPRGFGAIQVRAFRPPEP